jgi:hypothetical protein
MAELLELHTPAPLPAVSIAVAVDPTQAEEPPVIVPVLGAAPIERSAVANDVPQALLTIYVMISLPTEIAVTTPEVLTVATAGLLDDHVPPATVSVSELVLPAHMVVAPTITPS